MSDLDERCEHMTQRSYAAIHLRVPDSGIPELDEMIRKALRVDLLKNEMFAGMNQDEIDEALEIVEEILKEAGK